MKKFYTIAFLLPFVMILFFLVPWATLGFPGGEPLILIIPVVAIFSFASFIAALGKTPALTGHGALKLFCVVGYVFFLFAASWGVASIAELLFN